VDEQGAWFDVSRHCSTIHGHFDLHVTPFGLMRSGC